jgi:hypothetical protein
MQEAAMAKGQQRSNREVKKPKKNAGSKSKAGAPPIAAQPARNSGYSSARKP